MAGHSKWANIRHKKAKEDSKRSKVFTKVIKELTVAAREGGGDPTGNPRLSLAIDNAKAVNLPKDNMERAIKRGTGEGDDAATYEEVTFEGYGPGGIAYFVEVTTDNNTRSVADIRHIFTKHGGNMGTNGSVSFLFEQKGMIRVLAEGKDEEEFMLEAIEAGADDIQSEDEFFVVYTTREELFNVRKALEDGGNKIESAELVREATTETKVDAETALSNLKMMDKFEDNDDVTNVFTNMLMDEETIQVAENME
ncbi:MAG TPA: YebC/PmpR family DNA-binding transcriptional regulator [Balneola sp.]|jgi:YebC/PmpR family DNA-binding regulatory protein|nr:YebC/PmpR family DNA-binding transcriptional regulator [Bacteroidota bacterium]MAC05777.1 YebC/PmpR family DNA-binding transcriptional regulator [Balneola sp.]MAO77948.1 YebC/PmpR family DNA-binding transcriptional regulator [Balneola sp.]MBF65260.1 YebC/PmpR family DNA-binding transcriptional regulator [Balneola sp.]HAH51462.1 YebC/PmpR family DNA-binding transcriptional regulator [Balneola sp.]|tara:strand:- start:1425 stop:2183 length:759 start_codon:yes stop_codon:yes gene_type:complete